MDWQLIIKLIFSFSYILIVFGSLGMILFSSEFSFSAKTEDLEFTSERAFGLNGYQVWKCSWWLIITGTALQYIRYWLVA